MDHTQPPGDATPSARNCGCRPSNATAADADLVADAVDLAAAPIQIPPGLDRINFEDSACIAFDGTGRDDDPIIAEPVLNPAACNALRCTETGLLVPKTQLVPLPSTAPGPVHPRGARSIDMEITEAAPADCPDRWRIGARLSPASGEAALTADRALHGNPGTWLNTALVTTLPQPGRYYVSWDVNGQICATAGHCSNMWVQARVIDNETGAVEAPRRTVIQHQFSVPGGTRLQSCQTATAPITHRVTVTPAQGTKTLRLQGIFQNVTDPANCPDTTVEFAVINGGITYVTWHKYSD
jgi:hypothetical protein